jgi:hypothetical protein
MLFTSWASETDPAPGRYALGLDPAGSGQAYIWRDGNDIYWRFASCFLTSQNTSFFGLYWLLGLPGVSLLNLICQQLTIRPSTSSELLAHCSTVPAVGGCVLSPSDSGTSEFRRIYLRCGSCSGATQDLCLGNFVQISWKKLFKFGSLIGQ